MDREEKRDKLIDSDVFRKNVYGLIPEGASRILDFGCGAGGLSLRLQRDKHCTEVYGLDTNREVTADLHGLLDGVFHVDFEISGQELGGEFRGFFNYIILHDVLEHFKDPWYCLSKIRYYLAPGGRLIIATPNVQYWKIQHTILSGDFPYGPGLWHTGHLRWFTVRSLLELCIMGTYEIDSIMLEIPEVQDVSILENRRNVLSVSFPPLEVRARYPELPVIKINYPKDVSRYYPVFLAHKLLVVCRASGPGDDLRRMVNNCPELAAMRRKLQLPFDVYNPPRMHLLAD